MKLVIYKVSEKKPPVEQPVLRWKMAMGQLISMDHTRAKSMIPGTDEEWASIMPTEVPDMTWDRYTMHWDDLWSYPVPLEGE